MDYFIVDYDYSNLSEVIERYNNRSRNEKDIQAKYDEFIKDKIFKKIQKHSVRLLQLPPNKHLMIIN